MYDIYIVQEGDTLDSIAKKFNTNLQTLYEINKNIISLENLVPGTRIIVPVAKPTVFNYYVVKKGDTLYRIGQNYGVSVDKIAEINGLDPNEYIYENQVLLIPKSDVKVLVTKEGDTLEKITRELDVPSVELLFQNPNLYLLADQLITYKKASNND